MTGGDGKKPPVADRLAALTASATVLAADLRHFQRGVDFTRDGDRAALAYAVASAGACAASCGFLAERARAAGEGKP